MWNILGLLIRPYGLTVNEEGLYIRIPELESKGKKRARIFLSDSPSKVLEFLIHDGSRDEWNKRFPSVTAMYAYVARCKWYRAWLAHEKQTNMALSIHRERLKANDRNRMRSRPIFARWIEEYVPQQLRAMPHNSPNPPTVGALREHTRTVVFKAFPGAEERYAQELHELHREEARSYVKNVLINQGLALPESIAASVLPLPQEGSSAEELEISWRNMLRFGLRRILVHEKEFRDLGGNAIVSPPGLRDERGALVAEKVKAWIGENWERVGQVAWVVRCVRSAKYAEEMRVQEEWSEQERLEQERLEQEGLVEVQAVLPPSSNPEGVSAGKHESGLGGS